jgi:hypothetical protein
MSYLGHKCIRKHIAFNKISTTRLTYGSSPYDVFNATRDLIMLEVPNIKNIYWEDGKIVWEFRERDDKRDNKTYVRVNLPPIEPLDSEACLLCSI